MGESARVVIAIASIVVLLLGTSILAALVGIALSSFIIYSLLVPISLIAAYGYAILWVSVRRALMGVLVGLLGLGILVVIGPAEPQSYRVAICTLLLNPLTTISAVVLAPIVEENLFRGVITEVLKRRLGPFKALIISSTIFAAIHAPSSAILVVAYFAASLAVTSIYLIAGLVPSVLFHFMVNLSTYLSCVAQLTGL